MMEQTESSLLGDETQKPEAEASARPKRRSGGGRFQQKEGRGEPSLNFEELRELIKLMAVHGLTEFELERDSFRVHLKRDFGNSAGGIASLPPVVNMPQVSLATSKPDEAPPSPIVGSEEPIEENLTIITAPIVGTFYRSPSPTSEVFVKSGSMVEPDTVVCIIEAMKLMNEIQAETTGEVVKIYVENGQPVEYGQKLFGIRP